MNRKEYLLICLMEGATEVAHAASKTLRFTPYDSHTIGGPTNLENLVKEVNELKAVIFMLEDEGIELPFDYAVTRKKIERMHDYMDYSQKLGVLDVSTN